MKSIMSEKIHYQLGIPETLRDEAVQLYDEAFGPKFAVAIKNKEKRLKLLEESLQLRFALSATVNNKLVGLAGFHTAKGSLTKGITGKKLYQNLGFFGSVRAALIFSLYERKSKKSELLMDGIAVRHHMRGRGVGTQLLNNLKAYAREHKYDAIRLDVIDINQGARRLYERQGFKPKHTEHFGYLRWLLGFGASTTMVYQIEQEDDYNNLKRNNS